MKGLGNKSVDEIKAATEAWLQKNLLIHSDQTAEMEIDEHLRSQLQTIEKALEPIVHIYWMQLYSYAKREEKTEALRSCDREESIKLVLRLPEIEQKLKRFWESTMPGGMIQRNALISYLSCLELTFRYSILLDAAIETNMLCMRNDIYLVFRESYPDAYKRLCDAEDRTSQILWLRTQGKSLQEIGDMYGLTRERVRQIALKKANQFPSLFEDYFSEPYSYFYMSKPGFLRAFPDVSAEGFEYLSIRYPKGKNELDLDTLNEYDGAWKEQLEAFLEEETGRNDRETISRSEMVMRVLISNADTPLSMEELEQEYYSYVKRRDYPLERLKINMRSVGNYLRIAKGIVYDKDNKVRFCDADPKQIWKNIDFSLYKNTVISSELIFRDYRDLMDDLDIRDGYELFYIIKSSLSMCDEKNFTIRCRRVPVMVLGEASEEAQAIKLLKEISPVSHFDYFTAYEDRYGVRKETAQANPAISNAVVNYYADGQYIIDVPSIDERDVPVFINALSSKTIWFIEEIEELFGKICIHSSLDAINEAAFRRIGYMLHAGYAFDGKYGTGTNYLDEEVFSKDIVDLHTLDRRLVNLQMFEAKLKKKKQALEYFEVSPKVLMSMQKVNEVYQISTEEVQELQATLSVYCELPFFNAHSIWHEIEHMPIVEKLQGNDWMLTSILSQQEAIHSLRVAGGIILSLDSASLSISKICEWLVSMYGKMTIKSLEKTMSDKFGTRIAAYKLAEKLRSSGAWDRVVTDTMDEYMDNLADADLLHFNADDLLEEE